MKSPEVEELFAQFVRKALASDQVGSSSAVSEDRWSQPHEAPELTAPDAGEDVHLLTKRKSDRPLAGASGSPKNDRLSTPLEDATHQDEPGHRYADSEAPEEDPLSIPSRRDHIPVRELERAIAEMAQLIHFGHLSDVREQTDALIADYPNDLLLLRRVSELFLEMNEVDSAVDSLLRIVAVLFAQRHYAAMREVLLQILDLHPSHAKASKLLELVEARFRDLD